VHIIVSTLSDSHNLFFFFPLFLSLPRFFRTYFVLLFYCFVCLLFSALEGEWTNEETQELIQQTSMLLLDHARKQYAQYMRFLLVLFLKVRFSLRYPSAHWTARTTTNLLADMISFTVIKMGRTGWFYVGFVNATLNHIQETYDP
jgi:hypothetical protein